MGKFRRTPGGGMEGTLVLGAVGHIGRGSPFHGRKRLYNRPEQPMSMGVIAYGWSREWLRPGVGHGRALPTACANE